MAFSTYALYLGDTLNGGCTTYFVVTPSVNPFEKTFHCIMPNTLPVVTTWDFGDGGVSSGLNPVHTYCCFGTYMVQLTTTNNLGCTATYTAPVVVSPDSTGNLTISGQVFAGNNWLAQGNVTLFGTDPATGYFFPVQNTNVDSAGFYNFQNVSQGTYIILAIPAPDSMSASQFLPTFYGNVIFWEQATAITLGTPANPYNIYLVSFDSINGGTGVISGQLLGGGKSMLTAGQEVLLLDASGNPVREIGRAHV